MSDDELYEKMTERLGPTSSEPTPARFHARTSDDPPPRVAIPATAGPAWLAARLGRSYAEDIEDVRARVWVRFRNVRLGHGYAREAFLRSLAAARERLSDLREYRAHLPR